MAKYSKRKKSLIRLLVASISLILITFLATGSFLTGCNRLKENIEKSNSIEEFIVNSTKNETTEEKTTVNEDIPFEKIKDKLLASNYRGLPYIVLNNNKPYFKHEDYSLPNFQTYAPLDNLGRCTYTYVKMNKDDMPKKKRESIGMVKPTGWHTSKYDFVDQSYLYNRCHLIGYQFTGQNANPNNLITGTRYLNIDGMNGLENKIASYVRNSNDSILYRVTPIFTGNNLLAEGVLMEASSVKDYGKSLSVCVFAYNVQPGVIIDYKTGANRAKN